MRVTAVVGANWGDEGKGRMVDLLAQDHELVVRYQGGGNAGHTVITPAGKFVLHLLPSGVLRPDKLNILGPGVALDVALLERELAGLAARGVVPRLAISSRAQLLLPFHRLLDECEEQRLGARSFGSTRSGIAPFYADKAAKIGIRVEQLFDGSDLSAAVERILVAKNVLLTHLYGTPIISADAVLDSLKHAREVLAPFMVDCDALLDAALARGAGILLEGQLGALRDIDHGVYPWVTSSSPLAGFASVGAGVPAASIQRVVAVTKAYSSAVGAGPFVTELSGEAEGELRARGGDAGEYGATTGRPRRVGWFDAVATRHGCRRQGATEVALTCLDVLGYLDEIPICVAYRDLAGFGSAAQLSRAEPVYETLPGWRCALGALESFEALPTAARDYVLRVEQLIGVRVRWISYGPQRDQVLDRG